MKKHMSPESLLVLCEYNNYANQLLLETVAKLTVKEFTRDPEISRGSVQKTLLHVMECEAYFLAQIKKEPFENKSLPELNSIMDYWEDIPEQYINYLTNTNQEMLEEVITLNFGSEKEYRFPVWQLIMQVFNHSTIHRGELSIILTQLGNPMPDMDILIQFGQQSDQPLLS